ncbi:hypothetical protein [Microbacterium testaceum]|nr:hypothetical protein [Microbacterium testaceum]
MNHPLTAGSRRGAVAMTRSAGGRVASAPLFIPPTRQDSLP